MRRISGEGKRKEGGFFINGLIAFLISLLPVLELRGGMVFAAAKGVPYWPALALCLLGNILPVPLILLFLRRIFTVLRRFSYTQRLVLALERRARAKEAKMQRYQLLGLFLLVAAPLPGTGAWTGALVASVCGLPVRRAFPAVALGVLAAGLIMSALSFWIPGLFAGIRA